MSNLQEPTSPYKDKDASPSDYGLNMPDLPPPSSGPPGSGYPASMELYEMEGYVLQSLELLASTPTTQYYRPEIPHHEALPQSPLATSPPPRYDRWDGRQSFQQVHQRVLGGQDQHEQPCYPASSSLSTRSSAAEPNYPYLSYHSNTLPESPSAAESSNSQSKAEEPSLKRQRNTAASARFRAKKKRHEQLQAQSAREKEAIINRLENRVTELETENRWLKDLLIDKAEATARKDSKAIADDRKGSEHKDGVGTSSK